VTLSDGRTMRADYLVGCDGGRSLVRKQAGIEFPGWDPSTSWLIAEVELAEEAPWGTRRDEKGFYGLHRLEDGKRVRVLIRDPEVMKGAPSLDDLRAALTALYGSDYVVHSVSWLSRFSVVTRQAANHRD